MALHKLGGQHNRLLDPVLEVLMESYLVLQGCYAASYYDELKYAGTKDRASSMRRVARIEAAIFCVLRLLSNMPNSLISLTGGESTQPLKAHIVLCPVRFRLHGFTVLCSQESSSGAHEMSRASTKDQTSETHEISGAQAEASTPSEAMLLAELPTQLKDFASEESFSE